MHILIHTYAPRLMITASCRDIANFASGFGMMGLTWPSLSRNTVDSLLFGIKKVAMKGSPSELASTLYGVALMECQWEQDLDPILQADVAKVLMRILTHVLIHMYQCIPIVIKM